MNDFINAAFVYADRWKNISDQWEVHVDPESNRGCRQGMKDDKGKSWEGEP
jgi:hypothetical protein